MTGDGRKVRLLDAWEDGEWLWRDRERESPEVELAIAMLRRATIAATVLSWVLAYVDGRAAVPGSTPWTGALLLSMLATAVFAAGWVGTEWVLRAQAGARAERDSTSEDS